jgi:putative membrane protein
MKATKTCLAISLGFVLALCGLTACSRDRGVEAAREDQLPTATPAEQDFMMKTAQGQKGEIEMARVALNKSTNQDVKDYATMIERDHNNSLKALAELMQDKNVSQPKTLTVEAQQAMSSMNGLTGPEFDREFANMMVSEHQRILEMFRAQQASAQNIEVKDYVEAMIPTLEMHLDKAQRLQSKLFNTRTSR